VQFVAFNQEVKRGMGPRPSGSYGNWVGLIGNVFDAPHEVVSNPSSFAISAARIVAPISTESRCASQALDGAWLHRRRALPARRARPGGRACSSPRLTSRARRSAPASAASISLVARASWIFRRAWIRVRSAENCRSRVSRRRVRRIISLQEPMPFSRFAETEVRRYADAIGLRPGAPRFRLTGACGVPYAFPGSGVLDTRRRPYDMDGYVSANADHGPQPRWADARGKLPEKEFVHGK
jgi:hypothetical protein